MGELEFGRTKAFYLSWGIVNQIWPLSTIYLSQLHRKRVLTIFEQVEWHSSTCKTEAWLCKVYSLFTRSYISKVETK